MSEHESMSLEDALGLFDLVVDAQRAGRALEGELLEAYRLLQSTPQGRAEFKTHERLSRTALRDLARTVLRDLEPESPPESECDQ